MAKLEAAKLNPHGPSSPSSAPLAAQDSPAPAAAAAPIQPGSDAAAKAGHPPTAAADAEDNDAATARPDGDVDVADVESAALPEASEDNAGGTGSIGGPSEPVSSSGSGSRDGDAPEHPAAASSTGGGDEDSDDEGGEDEEDGDEEGEDEDGEYESGEAGSKDGDGEEVAAELEPPKPRMAQVTFLRFLSCLKSSKQSVSTGYSHAISLIHCAGWLRPCMSCASDWFDRIPIAVLWWSLQLSLHLGRLTWRSQHDLDTSDRNTRGD